MKEIKVRATFLEPMLGTASANPELHAEFIASKAPDAMSREEEVAALGVEAVEEKSMTTSPIWKTAHRSSTTIRSRDSSRIPEYFLP
jgi:hypothetical protein